MCVEDEDEDEGIDDGRWLQPRESTLYVRQRKQKQKHIIHTCMCVCVPRVVRETASIFAGKIGEGGGGSGIASLVHTSTIQKPPFTLVLPFGNGICGGKDAWLSCRWRQR